VRRTLFAALWFLIVATGSRAEVRILASPGGEVGTYSNCSRSCGDPVNEWQSTGRASPPARWYWARSHVVGFASRQRPCWASTRPAGSTDRVGNMPPLRKHASLLPPIPPRLRW